MGSLLFLSIAILISISEANVKGTLKVDCGSFPKKPGFITFTGDAKAVFAFGENGVCQFKELQQLGSFGVSIGYKKTDKCKFVQSAKDRDNFVITIETRTLHEKVEGADDEHFIVACNYMRYAKVSITFQIASQFKPPTMKLFNKAKAATSTFDVFLTNIQGNKLRGAMAERRIVRMRAIMKPAKPVPGQPREVGFQPVQCVAAPDTGGKTLVILSDGCGSGYPWTNRQGFTMKGFYGDSPSFRLFKLGKRSGIKISCDFIVCTKPCNQNSCPAARNLRRRGRGKRSPDEDDYDGAALVRTTFNIDVHDESNSTHKILVKPKLDSEGSKANKEVPPMYITARRKPWSTHFGAHKSSMFSVIFITSSLVLVTTVFLTLYILSKIHETHELLKKCKNS